MNRQTIITSLQDARVAHHRWLKYGKILLDGDDLRKAQTPLKRTECGFGKWFYSNKEHIKNIPGFNDIESLHAQFHLLYDTLYLNAPKVHHSKGLFSSKRKQQALFQKHDECFRRLNKASKDLDHKLEQVEKTVMLMSDRLFERNKSRRRPTENNNEASKIC